MKDLDARGYAHGTSGLGGHHDYLLPSVRRHLAILKDRRVFDLGCGNGSVAHALSVSGYDVTGVDPSEDGVRLARETYPGLRVEAASAYDDLAAVYGRFPVVLSLEVVEHVYSPRSYAKTLFDLVEPGGIALVSTPYHGYLKNLALAFSGKMDAHFTALWDHGHIKFWSIKTLGLLLRETGFSDVSFERLGRVPPLAKSMMAIARKPG
jgi:2-polyprenyl-6-hydroxyphenyl methylase/3-demethylubiquinone-9 3-methyltransferase